MELMDGQLVKIRTTSMFYSTLIRSSVNPIDTVGRITSANNGNTFGNLRVTVQWPDGFENCYNEHDLLVVGDKP